MARRFELSEGRSNKFWEIEVEAKRLTVRFGRIGTTGQEKTKSFASPVAAEKESARLVAEKTGKGYVEKKKMKKKGAAAAAPAAPTLRPLKKLIGSPHWTSGPLVIAPSAVHDRWMKVFGNKEAAPLRGLKNVVVGKREGHDVVLLSRQQETMAFPWNGAVVLASVRIGSDSAKALARAPITEVDGWKRVGELDLAGDVVFFDAWSKEERLHRDRKPRLPLPLAKGRYVVELVDGIKRRVQLYPNKALDAVYRLVRLRPRDWTAAAPASKKARPRPPRREPAADVETGPLVASPAVLAAAKKLRSVGGTDDGGPVIMPTSALKSWWGLCGEDGEFAERNRHADKVSALNKAGAGVFTHDGVELLAYPDSDCGTMFHPNAEGGLLIGWQGADSAAGCLAAALSIPDKSWSTTKIRWKVTNPDLVMFGFSLDGRALEKDQYVKLRLAPGTYQVERCWEYESDVKVGNKTESTSIMALRLTARRA